MSRVAVVLNTGGADRCDGCSQLGESFRSVVELSNFAKFGRKSKNFISEVSGVLKDRIGMGASFRIEWDSRHRNRRDLNNPQNEKIFANDILPQ